MSMQLLGRTPEECVDFEISIGLYSKDERQNRIDELYKGASEILADMMDTSDSIV